MNKLLQAMDKVRKSEHASPIRFDEQRIEREFSTLGTFIGKESSPNREVQVKYSKTKVQTNDPKILKKNKILSINDDDRETTNQLRYLRTQVLDKLKAIGGNSLLITSANSYEGKTFTSINLGVSIAKEFDKTVLIIDADLRKSSHNHCVFSKDFFDLDVDKGLVDYLEGNAEIPEILINPGIPKLTLIPSGKPTPNAAELLNSAKMQEMMAEIKKRYPSDRLIIVDGPPLIQYPDPIILSRFVDGVLLIVEAEKTSSEDLRKVIANLKDIPIIGTVLNKNKG
ncbi:MAG: polysaccharide biosynthesis tyrosine autokinase [Proteobacteria bacterium]|nr:polysaccharide biosynthesis tyrosine autokinase [Pseudomonadota bacterium]